MAYADYEFYSSHYKNPIPEDDFNRLSFRADMFLDELTRRRLLTGFPSDEYDASRVKMAECELIRISYMLEAAEENAAASASGTSTQTGVMAGTTGVITSKSSGSESISYASPSELAGSAKEWSAVYAAAGDAEASNKVLLGVAKPLLIGVTDDKGVCLLYAGIG